MEGGDVSRYHCALSAGKRVECHGSRRCLQEPSLKRLSQAPHISPSQARRSVCGIQGRTHVHNFEPDFEQSRISHTSLNSTIMAGEELLKLFMALMTAVLS